MGKVIFVAGGRIPDSDIAAVRERTPIEEIVAEHVDLKPADADSLKGLSSFKGERTSLFHVRPNHGYYHCFFIGKDGDVFNFLMEMEHLSLPGAAEAYAEKIGFHINYEGGGAGRREEPGIRQRLIAANREARKLYYEQFSTPATAPAREFLKNRGLIAEHAAQFGCGYSPAGWDTLTKHLQRLGSSFEGLDKAGLPEMERMGPIDRFRHRLMWPIRSMSGDVIGFGARKLFGDDNLGKYMNTPETMLYKKSKVLFGLGLAKKDIAAGHQTVIVEGCTDVMAMHTSGVITTITSYDTAFGKEHLQLLHRLTLDDNFLRGELIYTFDGDEAGQKAAMHAFKGEQNFTGQSYIAVAPDGMDLCDLRQKKGEAAVHDLVTSRRPLIEFVLRTLLTDCDLTTADGRVSELRRVMSTPAQLKDTALRDEYAREVVGWIGWNDEAELVQRVCEKAGRPQNEKRTPYQRRQEEARVREEVEEARRRRNPALPYPNPRDPVLYAQREALKLTIQEPVTTGPIFDAFAPETFRHPTYRAVFGIIMAAGGVCGEATTQPHSWATAIMDQARKDVVKHLVTELGVKQIAVDTGTLRPYTQATLARLQEVWVGDQTAQLKAILSWMRPSGGETAYNSLFTDLLAMEQYRRELQAEAVKVVFE